MSLMNKVDSSSILVGSSVPEYLNTKIWNNLPQEKKKEIINNCPWKIFSVSSLTVEDQWLFVKELSSKKISLYLKLLNESNYINESAFISIVAHLYKLITDSNCLLELYRKIESKKFKTAISQSPNFDSALLILETIKK